MSTLGNIVSRCIAAVEEPGKAIKIHRAVEHGVPLILGDPELNEIAVREFLTVKVRAAISGAARKALAMPTGYVQVYRESPAGGAPIQVMVPRQQDLFDDPFKLNDGYSLEGGVAEMKRTRYLTQPEFRGLIRIRKKQLAADGRHFNKLLRTDDRLAEFWDNDPEMTYEEACALYVRHHGMPDDDEAED